MGLKSLKKTFKSKKLKRVGMAAVTGGVSELPYASGKVGAQRDADKALRGLEATGRDLSTQSQEAMARQMGYLDDTFNDQRGQIESALSGANQQDAQALADYMQSMGANQGQIAEMLESSAALEGEYLPAITADRGQRLNDIRNSDMYSALYDERANAAGNMLADAGLRRSTNAGETAADLAQSTLMDLDREQYAQDLNLYNIGMQANNRLADFLSNSNQNMANVNLAGRNAMSNRGYQNALGIADLIGNRGANRIGLDQQNLMNQMDIKGQLSQARAANQIAEGQNNMAFNMGLLNAGAGIFGGALSGGLFSGGNAAGAAAGGGGVPMVMNNSGYGMGGGWA